MKKNYFFLSFLFCSFLSFSQNVTITKIIEAGCADPFVKTVELYVDGTVDFSTEVTVNYMSNGGAWDGTKIDVTGLGSVTNSFVYIVRDIPLMQAEFPNTTFTENVNTVITSTATNGDDGYQIVLNGNVVSQFGKTMTDADNDTESNWNHNDAVATRKTGIADTGVWDRSQWDITAENDLDDFTNCQDSADPKTKNLETYFATLGSTYSLGSGSGWTPTANTCTTSLGDINTSCTTVAVGASDDTYTAYIDFAGGNNGKTFIVSTTSGTVGGDNPTSMATGTIEISGIAEGTDITVTINDTADGGVCDLSKTVESPACIPLIINEVLFDPASDDSGTTAIEGDANGDGTRDPSQDEFIEFFNISDVALDISGYKMFDATALNNDAPRHIFPASTIIPAKSSLVLFGGGTPTGTFGGAIVQTASEGAIADDRSLSLTNGGDLITIKNTNDDIALVYASSSTGINHGSNVSVTRSPDITGNFVLHTDANTSLDFSPGTKLDGATTLSIDNLDESNFKLFPNPVSVGNRFITIQSNSNDKLEVSVFNLLGKRVKSEFVNNQQLNIENLSTGIYLIKISQANSSITKKLLVK
ncbi:T9SS type A sorting domain-containing protein [Polaribacter porphyrae]|uniref:LTD domain-containing protein n=1 Tax=Polaribacter porphyrae TaxID=1137780 RepID=A0A2S7WQX1_9FLAO|nr:T9SS type A sorting domain-containing protein [Polaribacter porphyrae]PQJ79702.1 hypothetical protein BTO18_11190 [Polaribacter porphyrae]